jgi:predicted nucleic acid-binding protein
MGLILDSSVLIAAERKGSNARQVLSEIAGRVAGEDVAFSVLTLIELAHGAARAETLEKDHAAAVPARADDCRAGPSGNGSSRIARRPD